MRKPKPIPCDVFKFWNDGLESDTCVGILENAEVFKGKVIFYMKGVSTYFDNAEPVVPEEVIEILFKS